MFITKFVLGSAFTKDKDWHEVFEDGIDGFMNEYVDDDRQVKSWQIHPYVEKGSTIGYLITLEIEKIEP